MRIAYDAAPLMNARTGVGHYAATLLDRLLELDPGLEFRLFALTRNPGRDGAPVGDRIRLRHRRLPARVVVGAWESAGWPPGEWLVGDVDVVHGTNFWLPPIRRRNGVVTIHDLTFWLYPELCTAPVRRYRWIVPKVLSRCALVITPSETVRTQVASELGVPTDRIVVTPEGVTPGFESAAPDPALATRLGIDRPYILFVGAREPRKNLPRLIEAFARLPEKDLQLVLAGPPGWGGLDLDSLAGRTGLVPDRDVIFSGYLEDAELRALVAGAWVFAFPSIYEGFGLPPLEAMAAGVPVVAGRAGSLPEVLGEAPVWCDPLDVDAIAEALVRAATDDEERARAIEAGRARAATFDWNDTARVTLEAYRRIHEAGE
jgi:glycosyltransferase involved in cell wall biosynthesis